MIHSIKLSYFSKSKAKLDFLSMSIHLDKDAKKTISACNYMFIHYRFYK